MWPPWGLTQTSFGSPCFMSRYRSAIGCWLSRSPLTRSIGADGLQVGIGLRDDFFLARVEAVDAEHERRGPHVRRQAQIGDDLGSLERDAQRLDRRCERSRVLLERLEGARVGALLAGRKPLARPARDVEAAPGLVIVAALQVALADPAPHRRPFVGLEAVQARHRLARVLGLDAGERPQVALGAPDRLLLELLERAGTPALRERKE